MASEPAPSEPDVLFWSGSRPRSVGWVAALAILSCAFAASCGVSSRSATLPASVASTTIERLTHAQRLDAQMLALHDLPHGWFVDRRGAVPSLGLCEDFSFSVGHGIGIERDEVFDAGPSGVPALGERLVSFPTSSDAQGFFARNVQSQSCTETLFATRSPSSGHGSGGSLYSLSGGTDESQASWAAFTTVTGTGPSVTGGEDRLLASRGRVVALLYLVEPQDPATSLVLFTQLATKAIDRIKEPDATVGYVRARRLCRADMSRTSGATKVVYVGVTSVRALVFTMFTDPRIAPLVAQLEKRDPVNAFLAVCEYGLPNRESVQTYVDAAGHPFEVSMPLP